MPLGRSILKNCRVNASCVNCYGTLSINLPFFHGHSQVTGSAQSPLSAQAEHTPAAYCTAASPVLPAVPGCCRTRPPRLAYGVVFTGNSPKEKAWNFSVHQEVSGFILLKLELVGTWSLHLADARPFRRLKAPLGLSLLRYASQTRTFENTLISAACKKKQGKL